MFFTYQPQQARVHFMRHPVHKRRAHFAKRMNRLSKAYPKRRIDGHHRQVAAVFDAYAVNRSEQKEKVKLSIDLPGVKASDLDVSVDDHILTISGTRRGSKLKFSRKISLDINTVDTTKLSANLMDGVLTITAPKLQRIAPIQVKINQEPNEETVKTIGTSNKSSRESATCISRQAEKEDATAMSVNDSTTSAQNEDDERVTVATVETVDVDGFKTVDKTVKPQTPQLN